MKAASLLPSIWMFRCVARRQDYLSWCSSNSRSPDAASRDAFAAERFRLEQSKYSKRQDGG
jgi:hypothetical protein